MTGRPAPFPAGTRVLHVGPHKTGTTTVQAAFHQNREAAAAQGVVYPGKGPHPMLGAMAAATGTPLAGRTLAEGEAQWARIVAEVAAAGEATTVVSSEFLCEATPDRIGPLVQDMGADRIQVVITLRPLVRILASQWQQYMQNGAALRPADCGPYEAWLHDLLDDPESSTVTPSFWRRHTHDRLVRTWVEAVGADRVSVVVVDERDRRGVLDAFEALTSLTPGTLEPRELTANRSLTLSEVEMLRAFNERYREHGWKVADHTRLVRFGSLRHLQQRTPLPEEPKVLTPQWAVDRVCELGAAMAEGIAATGVRVVGDLSLLGDPSVARGVGANPDVVPVPVEVAARHVAGLVTRLDELRPDRGPAMGEIGAAVRADKRARSTPAQSAAWQREADDLRAQLGATLRADELSRPQLARVLAGRVRRRLLGR